MIYLKTQKDYYILIDGQGAEFASGCIFEGLEELAEKFQEWADCDGYEDPKLIGWTIGNCLEHWTFTLKRYQVNDWVEVEGTNEIDYKITLNK